MMRCWIAALALLGCGTASARIAQTVQRSTTALQTDNVGCEADTSTLPNETIVFRAHTHGYYNYLNPALLRVSDSVVLMFAEARKGTGGDSDAIDIAVRRSSDGGRSFGAQRTIVSRGNESCLCIVPVLTPKTHDVLVVFECEHKCGTAQQHMSSIRSTDMGLTFSAPAELSNISYVYGGPGPANAIVTSSGRILVSYQVTTHCPADWHKPPGFDGQTCVILSDDDGRRFRKGGCIPHFVGGSEGQVAQLEEDGAILLASRLYGDQTQHPPTGCRHFSTSTDSGLTFSDVFVAHDTRGQCLPDPDVFVAGGGIVGSAGCEASLLSLSGHGSKQVFFASPIDGGTKTPNGIEAGRINLTLFSAKIGTAADARTVKWETVAQVAPSQSEYSSMTLLDNNTIAIAFVDGRGAKEQGPNCGAGCCGRANNTIRMTLYAIKTDDVQKTWNRHHMALADRSLAKVANLSNVVGCVGVGWNTDHHHCSWNNSASAQPDNTTCISASPAEIITALQNEQRPSGFPVVFTLSEISDPTIPGTERFADHTDDGYYTPFMDSWVQGLTLRVKLWFTEYKRLGGTVDVLLLDFESCDYLNAGRMASQSNSMNETEFGSAIVKLPQWPALRQELETIGAPHGATFADDDMAQMKQWGNNQTDFRQYVWNAVVVSLATARALNTSIVEPVLELYPDAHISNYAHNYHVAGPGLRTGGAGCCNWGYAFNEERHSVAFGGSHVGTHASHSAYGLGTTDRGIAWWNLSANIKPLAVSTPWWQASVPNTAFGNLIRDVRLVRNAKAGAPHVPFHPYIKPKIAQRPITPATSDPHEAGQDGIYGDSDLWQEHVLHLMLSAATREVATWNFEFSTSANVLLGNCLSELDSAFNVAVSPSSESIQTGTYGTELSFDADYVLSGAIASPEPGSAAALAGMKRTVYRVTFRDPAVIPVQNTNGSLARFSSENPADIAEGKLGFVTVPIEGATLLLPTTQGHCKQPSDGKPRCPDGQCDIAGHCRAPPASQCSMRGYWLETYDDTNSLL